MESKSTSRYIRTAGIISLTGNTILAAVKLIIAFFCGSLAVLGDGIDSCTDVLISFVTIIVGNIILLPGDKNHPWGHSRIETTATMALSFIIFFAGSELAVSSLKAIITGHYTNTVSFLPILAAVISITGKSFLALSQHIIAKKSGSSIIRANALNMKSDIILSSGVLFGLCASKLLKYPVLDPVIALLVSAWVIKNAVSIFMEMNTELMDGTEDHTVYKKLFDAVAKVRGVTNPHSARIRKIGTNYDIDLDIELAPSMPLYEAHELSEEVEEQIRLAIPETYAVTIHLEPLDSDCHQREEKFGLNPEHLEENLINEQSN